MARYINDTTKVVVNVDDSKADRFVNGWTLADGATTAPADDGRPKGNGSRDDWAAYATAKGVTFTDDAGRDDIKAAVEAAETPQS